MVKVFRVSGLTLAMFASAYLILGLDIALEMSAVYCVSLVIIEHLARRAGLV